MYNFNPFVKKEMSFKTQNYHRGVLLILFLAALFVFLPVVSGRYVFWGGEEFSRQVFPLKVYALSILKQGIAPLWNPLTFCGEPLLGNPEAGVFYPLWWLGLFLPTPLAYTWVVIFNFFLFSVFQYLLVEHFCRKKIPAVCISISAAFSNVFIRLAGSPVILDAAVFAPLILYLALTLRQGRVRNVPWLAFAFSLQALTGEMEVFLYTSILACAVFVLYERGWKNSWNYVYCVLPLGGMLLSSVQVLPELDLFFKSFRLKDGADFAYFAHGQRLNFFNFLAFPSLYLSSGSVFKVVFSSPSFADTLFFACLPLVFCFAKKDAGIRFFSLCLLAVVLYSFGLDRLFPVGLRGGFKAFAVFYPVLSGALLGRAFAALPEKNLSLDKALYARVFWVLVIWFYLSALMAHQNDLGGFYVRLWTALKDILLFFMFFGMYGFLVQTALMKGGFRYEKLLVVIVFFSFLGSPVWRMPVGQRALSDSLFLLPSARYENLYPALSSLGGNRTAFRVWDFSTLERSGSVSNLNLLFRVPGAGGFSPLGLLHVKRTLSVLTPYEEELRQGKLSREAQNVLELLGVRYVMDWNEQGTDFEGKAVVPSPFPRFHIARRLKIFNSMERGIEALKAQEIQKDTVFFERAEGGFSGSGEETLPGKVLPAEKPRWVSLNPNHFSASVNLTRPAYLVFSDTFHPGWKAYVNGRQGKILKANFVFKGVYLEGGRSFVEFVYEPKSFYAGFSLSLLSYGAFLLAWGMMLLWLKADVCSQTNA